LTVTHNEAENMTILTAMKTPLGPLKLSIQPCEKQKKRQL